MALSFAAVNAAKGKAKAYKLADTRGLYLLVTPEGGRYWRMNYRFDAKQRTLAFGVYPDVGLADARAKRDAARKLLAEGIDPPAKRRQDEAKAKAKAENTFKAIATEWLAKCEAEERAPATLRKLRWLLEFTYPSLGERAIDEITAPELLKVLRTVEVRGRHESARRLRGTCGTVFRYAIATGRAERDISADLIGALVAPKIVHRAAVLEPKAVGQLLRAIDGYEGQPTVQIALRLAPHLFARPGELRLAEWDEFDPDEALWTIPASKTKMRRPHRVPLSKQVIALLEQLAKISGDGRYLFPSVRSAARSMSDNTLNAALRRLGYDKTQMTAHGFRAMASTLLNESGKWHPDAIERQLAHVEKNEVRRAYARGEHWADRVAMMQYWSDYLDQLQAGAKLLKGRFGRAS